MPTRRCCCGLHCFGCCFPEAEGVPQQLVYELSAPACIELDGFGGVFLPQFETNQEGTQCGNCLCYINDDDVGSIIGTAYEPVVDDCNATPCSRNISFYLMCDRLPVIVDDENENTDPCCQDIKLLVAFDDDDVAGDRPRPTNICRDFLTSDGLLLENLIELLPIACTCKTETEPFVLVYDLSELAFLCDTFFSGGPCDGQPNCCVPGACDFTGAILTVTEI